MNTEAIIPHLFRTEYSKIVAVLTKVFGIEYLTVAEDLTSETFLAASEIWPYKGVPDNPQGWLHTVARNKANNYFNRNKIFRDKIRHHINQGDNPNDSQVELDIDLTEENIEDSQLQMMFVICHPSIPVNSQIALALRVLCGFGIEEIANAFLTNKETINKRLQRAKDKLRAESVQLVMPDENQIQSRLNTVLHTLYLLFSEGYYSESNVALIRKELCFEAMHLCYFLIKNQLTNRHETSSLMALMCFQASRLDARLSGSGELIVYANQDSKLWDQELIEKGFLYLQQASKWEVLSKYYLEASIAYWHTVKTESIEKWSSILHLYDQLLKFDNTPITALNRLYALSKIYGKEKALEEAEWLALHENHFYHLLLSELYSEIDPKKSMEALKMAFDTCKSETERSFIQKRITQKEHLQM